MKKLLLIICFTLGLSLTAQAELRLPALVGDNMVLQQNSRVCLWGWSSPSAGITISASWGAKATAKANSKGEWKTFIDTAAASAVPATITLKCGNEQKTIRNILLGEVWVCSGQSNMDMTIAGYNGCPVEGYNDFVRESARMSSIRHFKVNYNAPFEPAADVEGAWQAASPQSVANFGAVPYLFGRELYLNLNVPIGIINTSWGGSCIEAWMSLESQKQFSDVDIEATLNEKTAPTKRPCTIFNGMILPIVNYTIKGFCWYQGCSNTGRPSTYADKTAAMVELWRGLWNNPDLPFYYVELVPYNNGDPMKINYALLREQQAKVLSQVKNTGMAQTNDLAYPYEGPNIHPTLKAKVAQRLAALALSRDYGYGEALRTLGPRYKSVKFDGGKAIVEFYGAERGFGFRGEPVGFEIAGADKVFYPAKVTRREIGALRLIIGSDAVAEPVAVRYCFRNFLIGNVFDNYGMPIVPFRSDDF